jgi:voltage-gated potassium channel
VAERLLLALGLVAVSAMIVYLGRHGYRDAAHPGRPLSVLGSVYYATVALSTTGYGDIVPVSAGARLVNTILITPIRVIFLIVLVGTTLEVLTERTRTSWRIARWRSKMKAQTIIVGYGTKGRSVARSLVQSGTTPESIVVVDPCPQAVADANTAGLVAVTGDGTRRQVLSQAQIASAIQVVIAVGRDDTAVLVTLTARQLNPAATIVAAAREEDNQDLLRQSGADEVVVSSGTAGQLLAISAQRPAAGRVMADLLDHGRRLHMVERAVTTAEAGRSAREIQATVIAVLRADQLFLADQPEAAHLLAGDRLILIGASHQPEQDRRWTETKERADADCLV